MPQSASLHISLRHYFFSDIINNPVARATLLDDDTSTCMTLNTSTSHKQFEWIEMEITFNRFVDVLVSGHRFTCQRTICDTVFPVLLYRQELSMVDCDGGSESCNRYRLCELVSQTSAADGLIQCSYRCPCNQSSGQNCQNLMFLFDRKLNTLQTMPIEICDISADIIP